MSRDETDVLTKSACNRIHSLVNHPRSAPLSDARLGLHRTGRIAIFVSTGEIFWVVGVVVASVRKMGKLGQSITGKPIMPRFILNATFLRLGCFYASFLRLRRYQRP